MRNAVLLAVVLVLAGCSKSQSVGTDAASATSPAAPDPAATTASSEPATTPPPAAAEGSGHRVNLMPGLGAQVAGALSLVPDGDAVVVTGLVTGLAPDSGYGFHVHEKGDCSSTDFKSAGEHFNPTGQPHGNPGEPAHHLGDVPNLMSNNVGRADVNARIEGATLGDGGPHDLVGKAFVVHAKPDDYKTQPSGNSGDRIACGVVE
jgi:Cu-Zn family superoxide dismutase